jgi:hypothetical protein
MIGQRMKSITELWRIKIMNARKIGNVAIAIIAGFGTLFESENFWTTGNPANFVCAASACTGST